MRLRKKILGSILLVLVVALSVFAYAISHNDPCPAPAGAMATGADSMAAVRYHCYGPASVLQFERVPKPVIEDDMLLVKVVASSVNPLEWHYMRGEPYIMRM